MALTHTVRRLAASAAAGLVLATMVVLVDGAPAAAAPTLHVSKTKNLADGEQITATATGDLTLHGVTREVTIDLAARLDGTTFAVDGTTTVTFSDYGIDDPSGGPASVGDDGELEVLLVFGRSQPSET